MSHPVAAPKPTVPINVGIPISRITSGPPESPIIHQNGTFNIKGN